MKYLKERQQDQDQEQQNQDQQHSDKLELEFYDLDSNELDQTMKTLQKIKKISKQHLTKYKKKHKKLNNLFGEMSNFFIPQKKKLYEQTKAKKLLLRDLHKNPGHTKRFEQKRYRKKINQFLKDSKVQMEQQEIVQQDLGLHTNCYICRQKYDQPDDLYPRHCPKCSEFSKIKRYQTADLNGYTALVTGGRIKIGYQIALRFLRDGAKVYVTSRFSHDTLLRYQKQEDFGNWENRLFIIQCDFMSAVQVRALIDTIKNKVTKLDILVNNAAQTIVRPKQFFTIQMESQKKQLPPNQNIITTGLFHQLQTESQFPSIESPQLQLSIQQDPLKASQLIDIQNLDEFGQPIDKRPKNTWKQKIDDTSLLDCLSTQTINATVPFYLIGQLKSLMGKEGPSYIINVSSMQGVFYREYKSSTHPHTNMAKASLNMITRTCAFEFSKQNIYMNSVDTGWVTNENPYNIQELMKNKYKFQVPLDCLEGAMRVIDPIYQGVNNKAYIFGKFLKDYQESVW